LRMVPLSTEAMDPVAMFECEKDSESKMTGGGHGPGGNVRM
jgi:hypothetical protein